MQRTNDYENMVCECERILHLLDLIYEELDEAPRNVDEQEFWKAVLYCDRLEMTETLVYCVSSMINSQKETLEAWVNDNMNEQKKDSISA